MKWKCKVCGYIHEGELPADFVCPKCKQPASVFELIEEPKKNPYAGTKTEKNLWEAFAGESQARNKYTYFASVAKKAGYEQIAALFLQTAENEKEHAKLWFKALGELGDTAEISSTQQKAKTLNGQICMNVWLRTLKKKASLNSLRTSAVLQLLKSSMKNVTELSSRTLRKWKYSRRAA